MRAIVGLVLVAVGCARPSTATPGPSDLPAPAPVMSSPAALASSPSVEVAGRPEPEAPAEGGVAEMRADGGAPSAPEYAVAQWRVRLEEDGAGCKLAYGAQGSATRRLALDVTPPCHLLLWQKGQPRRANAERAPVGADGEPMVWRYPDKGGDTLALAVIGDPIPDMLRSGDHFRNAQKQGYHCAASAQGVLLQKDAAKTVTKRNQVGIFCVEVPIDEASFWLTAHEPRK